MGEDKTVVNRLFLKDIWEFAIEVEEAELHRYKRLCHDTTEEYPDPYYAIGEEGWMHEGQEERG
jgi:hypothetical protein